MNETTRYELEKVVTICQVLKNIKANNTVLTPEAHARCEALLDKVLTILEKVI